MKSFMLICFVAIGLLYGASTAATVEDSKKNLSVTSSAKKKASRKLSKIAKDIQSAEKDIVYLEKKIGTLEKDQEKSEQQYEVLKNELSQSEKDLTLTSQALEEKHQAFISLLSEQFSIIFAMEQAHEPTRESILSQEVYIAYKKHNSKIIATLSADIDKLKKQKNDKVVLRNKTKNKINRIVKKRDEYAQKKLAKEKLRKKLSGDEEKYNTKLAKIVDKQNSLRSTLAKLNILHTQEVKEATKRAVAKKEAMRLEKKRQREIREAKALARTKARKAQETLKQAKTEKARKKARLAAKEAEKENKKVYKESEKVRQVNSSYKKSQTYAYKGGKTISPLPGSKLVKKFGTYVDPIYKIKIFNESISLKPATTNANVKSVLNGKVILAKKTSLLNNIVIIEHDNGIHTIYAHLDKIAPTIQKGKRLKQGSIIGRVNDELMFEVTQKNYHINPLQLIAKR